MQPSSRPAASWQCNRGGRHQRDKEPLRFSAAAEEARRHIEFEPPYLRPVGNLAGHLLPALRIAGDAHERPAVALQLLYRRPWAHRKRRHGTRMVGAVERDRADQLLMALHDRERTAGV